MANKEIKAAVEQQFKVNIHNSLFRKYMTKLAIGIKTKDQYRIDEVREYMKAKQIDIGYNEDTQKIRLRAMGAVPVDFAITEFISMSDAEVVSVEAK